MYVSYVCMHAFNVLHMFTHSPKKKLMPCIYIYIWHFLCCDTDGRTGTVKKKARTIYIYIHIHTHTHIHTYTYVCMYVCKYVYIRGPLFVHNCIHMFEDNAHISRGWKGLAQQRPAFKMRRASRPVFDQETTLTQSDQPTFKLTTWARVVS